MSLNASELAKMISSETELLSELVDDCEYQSNASLLRKHCTKIRQDLTVLDKKLARFEKIEINQTDGENKDVCESSN